MTMHIRAYNIVASDFIKLTTCQVLYIIPYYDTVLVYALSQRENRDSSLLY
jgi:hypothetical protein